MPSRDFLALVSKEWRELMAARAFWLLLLMTGLLVGHSFITAVGLYAEASGIGGGPAALPQALTPLDGILVPTLGAYDLAATLLFPFVAIRMLSAEKENGGLKLLLQLPGSLAAKLAAKWLILVCGWLISLLPGLLALVLWKAYGGHLYVRVDLSKEKVGRESAKFLSVVGNWAVVEDGGRHVLGVDGRQWLRGQPAGGLAQKARAIYGSRNEEFIDNVKAFAYFPYAVARDINDFHDGEISIRFKLVAGQLDQCAGILFNLKSNGDYLTVRFNGKEDNVVLWTFNKGKRSFVRKGTENVPLAMNQWHTLQISVHGTSLQASLNGKHLLDYTLAETVSGKVGVWSKTDSVSFFDEFTVKSSR